MISQNFLSNIFSITSLLLTEHYYLPGIITYQALLLTEHYYLLSIITYQFYQYLEQTPLPVSYHPF